MAYPVARGLTRMSGGFGPREPIKTSQGYSPSWHGGVDFTPLVPGTLLPVYAVGRGTVYGVGLGGKAAGRNVMLRLSDGSLWWYCHLSRVDVKQGQVVADGEQVGLMGATGNVTGVHLHLERHWPRIDVETDPWPYIKDEPDPTGKTSDKADSEADNSTSAPAPPIQEQTMYRLRDASTGAVYLVTDRGSVHIKSAAHDALFDRMLGVKLDGTPVERPARSMNSLELATVAGYIAAAGAGSQAAVEKAVRDAVAGIDLGEGLADQVVDAIKQRL